MEYSHSMMIVSDTQMEILMSYPDRKELLKAHPVRVTSGLIK